MARRNRTLEILTTAGLVPEQLAIEQARGQRDSQMARMLGGLVPDLVNAGISVYDTMSRADLAKEKLKTENALKREALDVKRDEISAKKTTEKATKTRDEEKRAMELDRMTRDKQRDLFERGLAEGVSTLEGVVNTEADKALLDKSKAAAATDAAAVTGVENSISWLPSLFGATQTVNMDPKVMPIGDLQPRSVFDGPRFKAPSGFDGGSVPATFSGGESEFKLKDPSDAGVDVPAAVSTMSSVLPGMREALQLSSAAASDAKGRYDSSNASNRAAYDRINQLATEAGMTPQQYIARARLEADKVNRPEQWRREDMKREDERERLRREGVERQAVATENAARIAKGQATEKNARKMAALSPAKENELQQIYEIQYGTDDIEAALNSGKVHPGLITAKLNQFGEWSGLDTVDPADVEYISMLNNLISKIGQMRSGGAISEGEFSRLQTFIPSPNDSDEKARSKLKNLRKDLDNKLRAGDAVREAQMLPPASNRSAPSAGAPKKSSTTSPSSAPKKNRSGASEEEINAIKGGW